MRAVTVNAATYVKQDRTSVSITSKKTGWQKINGDYYFYNSKGRLICGSFKYKGYYYYSIANGKRFLCRWLERDRWKKILFPQQFHHGKGMAEDRQILLLFQQENRSDGKKYLDR